LEVALHVVDGRLRRAPGLGLVDPREPAHEQHGGGLRHQHHALAELAPQHVGGGGLAPAGAPGEGDAQGVIGQGGGRHARGGDGSAWSVLDPAALRWAMLSSLLLSTLLAVSARWSFEDAYDNVADGDWYMGQDNTSATLAWGESYVMSALAAMFRATGHPMYLERLAAHVDAVLQQRDDALGVTDYRGVSGACWRNTSYQAGGEPYCYAVHTGMLVYPMLEFVAALRAEPRFEARVAADGETLGDKAARYLAAAQESVAFHEFEWNDAGYYVFAPDATFLAYAGQDQPLNQSNAMGRVHVLLAELAPGGGDEAKALALASRMHSMIT